MTPEQTITHVEEVSTVLAQLREQVDRLVGRLADAELQLEDVRSERDQAARMAEALKAAIDNSAAIEEAIGIIAAKAEVGISAARTLLKGYSREHHQKMRAVAERIVAGQDPASLSYGDPEITSIIGAAGIPLEFWNALTLNGEIFR